MSMQIYSTKRNLYDLRNFNIMVVDDFDFMQSLIATMLKAFGVGNIMSASNSDDAEALLTITLASGMGQKDPRFRGVDLILTDWMMPDGGGRDLIQWIRNHKKDEIRFLPVIVVSAFTSEDVVVHARDAGANESMVKPVSAEKLAGRILSVIDHPRPFVKAPDFFGPDRRRHDHDVVGEERRKIKAEEIKFHHERL